MIKAVFIDIDETLTNSQREVTEKTKLEIKKCVENGVKIILTSGRSRREAMDFQEQIGTSPYIVSSNGASAYDAENGVEIYNERIDPQMVLQLIKYSRENGYRIKLNYSRGHQTYLARVTAEGEACSKPRSRISRFVRTSDSLT